MKQIYVLISIIFILTSLSYGQLTERLKLYVGGGAAQPVESFLLNKFFEEMPIDVQTPDNFENYWQPGVNIGAGFEYGFTRNLSLRADFSYSHFTFNPDPIRKIIEDGYRETEQLALQQGDTINIRIVDFNVYRGAVNIYTASLTAKASLPLGIVTPYIIGGGGYMHIEQQPIELSNLVDPIDFGFSFSFQVPQDKSDSFMGIGGGGISFNLAQNVHPFIEGNYLLGLTQGDNTIYYSFRGGFIFGFQ